MTGAKYRPLRLTSRGCPSCEDLRHLKDRIEDARRNARKLYRAALNARDTAALQILEEDLEQTLDAHKLVCYAVNAHLANQHSQTCGNRLAA
jgi:erythromycin esterase-like protein